MLSASITGLAIWILLFLAFHISGYIVKCSLQTNESISPLVGITCWNSVQEIILGIFAILIFLLFYLEQILA